MMDINVTCLQKSSNAIKKKSIFVRVEKTREVREPLVIQGILFFLFGFLFCFVLK